MKGTGIWQQWDYGNDEIATMGSLLRYEEKPPSYLSLLKHGKDPNYLLLLLGLRAKPKLSASADSSVRELWHFII
jgi:hypothetical protein